MWSTQAISPIFIFQVVFWSHAMEYLENIGEKVGLRNVDLDNIKKQASFFLRDKIKSARLFLTDATNSQL
jgi:hypothetical protein